MVDNSTSLYIYSLYGHSIRIGFPLPYLSETWNNLADFEILLEEDPFLSDEIAEIRRGLDPSYWFRHARLSDGSEFVRWTGLFDFLVSANGRQITGWPLTSDANLEKFQTYLLGQVLSFAMVRQGIEPLHATVIMIEGKAIAFLGDCGYGKSTLAGSFLKAGFPLLTDDMLVIKKIEERYLAYPGPPRIKLFPEIAKALIAEETTGTPMNPGTPKLIIPLAGKYVSRTPAPLKTFYALQSPDTPVVDIMIHPVSGSQALLALVQNTFNTVLRGDERLTQQFHWAAELSANIPVKTLAYPRELTLLPKVMDAILEDNA